MKKEEDEKKIQDEVRKKVLEFNRYLEKRAKELKLEEERFRDKVLNKKLNTERV